MKNDILASEMIGYYQGDPKRIQHFMKVTAFANLIAREEGMEESTREILEAAALTHDIGIKISEERYGSCSGKYQEQEGPAVARRLLERLEYPQPVIERVCWLIAHHHTYGTITELDYQILVEADFLVNLYEDAVPRENIKSTYEKIFRTEAGRKLCRDMFGLF